MDKNALCGLRITFVGKYVPVWIKDVLDWIRYVLLRIMFRLCGSANDLSRYEDIYLKLTM